MSDIEISELSFHEKLALMELAELLTRRHPTGSFEENYTAVLKLISEGDQVPADGRKLRPIHLNPIYGDPETTKCPVCGTGCYLAKSPKESKDEQDDIMRREFGRIKSNTKTASPKKSKGETDENTRSCLFHKLWTKAVGKEGYDKQEWLTLERMIWNPVTGKRGG